MVSSDDYRGRLKELQVIEDSKDDLIQEILGRLDDLRAQRDEAKSDLETEREARRRLQKSIRDSNPMRQRFAVLILHLDAAVFLFDDKSMRRDPAAGGEKIAGQLVDKVKEYIKKEGTEDSSNVQIVVKVYGDLFKIWKRYEAAGSNLGSSDLTRFFSHFNRKDSLVEFVDFGQRKECIEKKLTGILAQHLLDQRVEHILFGNPHQNMPTILAPLEPHLSSPLDTSSDHSSRLTLLAAPPFPQEWDDLGFRTTTHFNTLFTTPPIVPSNAHVAPSIPPRSPSHTPRPTRFKAVKEHHKSPPPTAPVPPPAVGATANISMNMPRLRIRKDKAREDGGWARGDERSPQRQVAFGRMDSGVEWGRMDGGGGGSHGRAPMQLARRDTYPTQRYPGVPPEAPSIPGQGFVL